MIPHKNNGRCERCEEIFETYPGMNGQVRRWFEAQQLRVPTFHIAEAGRGRVRQELMVQKGLSKAHYGLSAHNYNCAIDTFFNVGGTYSLDPKLYALVTKDLPLYITWYGDPHAEFYERPHFQLTTWRTLAAKGLARLVEPAKMSA